MKGEAWILIGVLSGARELSIGNPFSNSEARADPRFRFVNVSAYRYARASADVAAPTIQTIQRRVIARARSQGIASWCHAIVMSSKESTSIERALSSWRLCVCMSNALWIVYE